MKKQISGKSKDLGDNFLVRRVLPSVELRSLGAFVFFDHMGPVTLKTGNELVVRPHPHIGLSTITYLFDGEILHRDSLGTEQVIRPSEANWMTAGSGIVHSERSQKGEYEILEGIQVWVALPQEKEEIQPNFFHHGKEDLPVSIFPGGQARVILGSFLGKTSPIKVYSDLTYVDLILSEDTSFNFKVHADQDLGIYLARGNSSVADHKLQIGDLLTLDRDEEIQIKALNDSRLLILGGSPLKENRHLFWNFVSTSKDRIEAAKADWKAGRFPKVPNETEFIPLPE